MEAQKQQLAGRGQTRVVLEIVVVRKTKEQARCKNRRYLKPRHTTQRVFSHALTAVTAQGPFCYGKGEQKHDRHHRAPQLSSKCCTDVSLSLPLLMLTPCGRALNLDRFAIVVEESGGPADADEVPATLTLTL